MSEYIFDMPDDNEPIGDVYYPDERDSPMPVMPLVRCRDCKWCMAYMSATYCDKFAHSLPNEKPDGFCAWGERRDK